MNELKPKQNNENSEDLHGHPNVDYDQLLSSAGEFGRYQLILLLATFPFYAYGAFGYFTQVFLTEVSPNHWCWIPELENLTVAERRNLAIPDDPNSLFGYTRCEAYVANWSEVLLTGQKPNKTWGVQACQHGWEFNKSEIPYPTISSELGWVCDKDNYQATAQAIFFVGSIAGGFLVGWVADRYGRLPGITLSNMLGFAANICTYFANNFLQFCLCRFLAGMAYDNCMMMMYLLVLEYVAPKYRTLSSNLPFGISFTIASVALPWLSLASGHWKIICLVTGIPMVLPIIAPFVLPESPRWLISKGRIDEAVNKIKKMGQINKQPVPEDLVEQFKVSIKKEGKQKSYTVIELFKRPLLRRNFICMCLEFMSCMIVFDSLIRTISGLGYDYFISFTFISLTEFPSLLAVSFILDLTGRKWLSFTSLALCGIFCILSAFIGRGLPSVSCAVIARFFVNIACNAAMQWVAEMLPTPVRGSGTSVVHICGYIATVISPYIAYIENYVPWLPLVIVGGIALFGALCTLILPETAGKDIPQTLGEAEELIEQQKFFDVPFLRKPGKVENGNENPAFQMESLSNQRY